MRINSLFLSAIAILSFQLSGFAAQTSDISVPKSGTYYYWFAYSDINSSKITTTPSSFKDKKTTADLPLVKDKIAKNTVLFVLNAKTGNEAIVPVTDQSNHSHKFSLKESDFEFARRVKVRVLSSASNAPVAACVVKLQDGKDSKSNSRFLGEQTKTLDPASEGIAEFENVPIGTTKVTVQYGEGKSASQDLDIPADREQLVPSFDIPVVGEVDTVQTSSAEPKKGSKGNEGGESKQAAPQSSGVSFGSALVGIALLAAVLYGMGVVLKRKEVGLQEALKKLGIDLPSDDATLQAGAKPESKQAVDPTVCPFCGEKKDTATGSCACSLGGSRTSAGPAGQGARLIAAQGTYAGNIYPLSADSITIGREESNDLAFPQDIAVSRRHARLTRSNGEWTVHDEGSSNGTFVNGVKISDQNLRPGDEIQVGSTRLRLEI